MAHRTDRIERLADVPLQDPSRENAELDPALAAAARDVVAGGRFILGPHVECFEAEVADHLGVRHAVGVASGSDALRLTLEALGVGPGDEVITSGFSFFASAGAILHAGATPVFVDIRADSFNLDPAAVASAITERTAAILPVHLFGQMAAMEELGALARRHGLALVEDAAQAFGARQRVSAPGEATPPTGGDHRPATGGKPWPPAEGEPGRPAAGKPGRPAGEKLGRPAEGKFGRPAEGRVLHAGAVGDAGCLSFYPTKNLGAWGDGGMVVTDDAEVARRVRLIRSHGCAGIRVGRGSRAGIATRAGRGSRSGRGAVASGREPAGLSRELIGYNSRLDALQAAVLRVKLEHVEAWNDRRRDHAAVYDAELRAASGITTPPVRPGNRHVYQQYTIRCVDRMEIVRRLEACGIGYGIYYPRPLHLEEAFVGFGRGIGSLPETERAAREVLSLPVFPALRSDERSRVTAALC